MERNPQGGWLCERIHKPMCDWFQKHALEWLALRGRTKQQRNLLIVVPREFGKTVLITKAGLLWLHLREPELSTYIGSETVDRAGEFLQSIKEVLDGSDSFQLFSWLYGNWYNKDRDWTRDRVVHGMRKGLARGEPSFGTWGVITGLTGKHPDVICLDDPISYERMEVNSDWLNVVNRHVASLIPVLKGDGLRIFIGTRYHDGDLIGRAIRLHGCRSITGMEPLDVRSRKDGVWHMYFLSARDNHREPIFPEQWPDDRLKELERESTLKYYAQMENDPATEEVTPLTRRIVDTCMIPRAECPRDLRISIHIDTAFKRDETRARGDESVIQVWGHARDGSGDVYFLEGYGSNTWKAEEFNNKLVMVLQSLKSRGRWPFILTDESETGGKTGTWELTLQSWCHAANLVCPRVHLILRGGKRKLPRHITAADFWKQGKVRLVNDAPGLDQLVDQMLRIGVSRHDDWTDCASDVFDPEVYKPMRLPYADESLMVVRPYDAELQPGTIVPGMSVGEQIRAWKRSNEYYEHFLPPIQ